jgi:hypothetical protein
MWSGEYWLVRLETFVPETFERGPDARASHFAILHCGRAAFRASGDDMRPFRDPYLRTFPHTADERKTARLVSVTGF